MTNASVLRARKASLLGAFVVATLVSSQMAALSIAAPATGAVAPADNNDLMTDNGKGGDPALYLAAAQLQDKSTNASAGGTSSSGDPQQVIQPGDPTDSADPAPDGPGATPNVVFWSRRTAPCIKYNALPLASHCFNQYEPLRLHWVNGRTYHFDHSGTLPLRH